MTNSPATSSLVLPDLLPITPFTAPARGEVLLPGSKSLTNRALLLAALGRTPLTLSGALFSEDTRLMAAALRALGCAVEADEAACTLRVSNQDQLFQSTAPVDLFVGLAGTAARFLTALCAAAPRGIYRLDGVEQMRKRPMAGLIDALRTLGADVRCPGEEGFFPLEIHARGLSGGAIELDASASSQLLSALLMVAPTASAPIDIQLIGQVRWTFVEMTRRLMAEFGVELAPAVDGHFTVSPTAYAPPAEHAIEPDATAASYWQTLPFVVGGELALPGLRPPGSGLQGDAAYAEVLQRVIARPAGTLLDEDFREISDTFLSLAAITPLLNGPTRLTGLAHTRHQETDRVAGMATELRRLGQDVIEEEDSLTITPRPLKAGQTIETYGDHRFAMSFAILGCHDLHGDGRPWLSIAQPGVCAKTFPHFFELLASVREKSSSK
ncbi:3-phosphoshikimate 1-carboxyvinyltransferase [Actomonas aquatica]|uniref:3-phosphoshikimate 1-carboxyvinyltransferase n=1 Tax=Actomonas aquatica TaxID=2866162 RepID=A0ABZ1C6N1_9BACT|nr:3-phosphoshikimate 1-carboxyvinyltransferase [Opitutus sp. WL0086]WRQ87295.1 3-phosphoshikimate 1-carboxyvinyltransferase [Opitutus sp. WL0086]